MEENTVGRIERICSICFSKINDEYYCKECNTFYRVSKETYDNFMYAYRNKATYINYETREKLGYYPFIDRKH